MKKTLSYILLILGAVAFFACNDGIDYKKMRDDELALLDEYMAVAHPGAEATASGLYYFNEPDSGEGDTIKVGDQVRLFYATWTLDKTQEGIIDSFLVDETNGYLDGHRFEPQTFIVGTNDINYKAIPGVEEALTYMQPGTRSRLVINSELAYGQQGHGYSVGAFQTVLMEVEIYKVIPFETSTDDEE